MPIQLGVYLVGVQFNMLIQLVVYLVGVQFNLGNVTYVYAINNNVYIIKNMTNNWSYLYFLKIFQSLANKIVIYTLKLTLPSIPLTLKSTTSLKLF